MIASNFDVWLNNPSDDAVNFAGGTELFGFGVGFFEEKEISSLSMDVFFVSHVRVTVFTLTSQTPLFDRFGACHPD